MDIILLIAGLAILIVAGDVLVRGAVALSLRLGVPMVIVGLTVVAFGTSLPELLVSIDAALSGVPGIAVGNVVGSNITNILLVLGVPAVISRVPPSGSGTKRSYWLVLGASGVLIALCFAGSLYYMAAAVLLTLLALMLADMWREARKDPSHVAEEVSEHFTPMPPWKVAAFILVGIAGLPVGAHLLIEGAVGIARQFGVSEAVIGLSLVALGTSLPELATTVMAGIRKQTDVAMGNVLGSNLFNILAILGITSLFGPLPVEPEFLARDLWVMLASALLLAPFVLGNRVICRRTGTLFLILYLGYYAFLFTQAGGAA
ncbi:calcium/sodium antiporter [Amaricoccus macauensis]|uniref:calcium/sodium antiporter n=1 Tax=Amaricoccus macauensis TaxID=57001 RepID=UPI003C7D0F56